jgi:hypothetical protein
MAYAWGPHFIVPSEVLKKYSGSVLLRESFDEELLHRELDALGIKGAVHRITNPWYYREKGAESWIKIGESEEREANFAVRWDCAGLRNGSYEILGLMHVFVRHADQQMVIARSNVVEVTVEN